MLKKPAHGTNEQALRVFEMQEKHIRLSKTEQAQSYVFLARMA